MKSLLIVFLLFFSQSTIAFESNGIKDGMTKAEVKKVISTFYNIQYETEGNLVTELKNDDFHSYNFCKGKLVGLQDNYKPSFKTLVLLVNDLTSKYGQTYHTHSNVSADPKTGASIYNFSLWWAKGLDTVSLNIFNSDNSSNDSLHIYYEIKNSCYK